jgi:hypothetical protein
MLGLAPLSWGQQSVWTQNFINQQGQPLAGASIAVCTSQPTVVVPCGGSSEATVYSGFSGSPVAQPLFTDLNGLASIFAASGNYYIQVYGVVNGITIQTLVIPITVGGTGGGGGGAVSSVFGRTGAVVAVNTDYGTGGIQQNGTGVLNIIKNSPGTLVLSETPSTGTNYMEFFPDSAGGQQIRVQDQYDDFVLMGSLIGFPSTIANSNGVQMASQSTGSSWFVNATDIFGYVNGAPASGLVLDINSSQAVWNLPVNVQSTLNVQGNSTLTNLNVTGTCTGCSSGSVSTVVGTINQISTSGSSNVTISLPNQVNFPGNLLGQQLLNGSNFFTIARNTDTTPSGNLFVFNQAGGSKMGGIDVFANFSGTSFTATGTGAGYSFLTQGTDNSGNCPANSDCSEAPTSISTAFTRVGQAAGPSVSSVETYGALSATKTQKAFTPTTNTSPSNIQTADSTVAGCGSGVILTSAGTGDSHCSGTNITNISPSLMGPASPYTNSTTSATTVFSYTNTIPASSVVLITCVGTYSFSTAVEAPEFGINFSSAPTLLRLNVSLGVNATTQTGTFGLQTTNGALITAPASAASTGTQYPVVIQGGVSTNAATTFTVQGATSNASGTLNVAANAFTCTVK